MDFDKELQDILSNPEQVLSDTLTADEILQIQRKINPYSHVPAPAAGEKKKFAICSYTNFQQEYMRKFAMTSLVSFIFTMLKEWEAPAEARRWTPKKAAAAVATDAPKLDLDSLIEQLETLLDVAKRTKAAAIAGAAATEEEEKPNPDAAALSLGMYAHMVAEDIKQRIPKTIEIAQMSPEVKAEFDKFPEAVKQRYASLNTTIEMPSKVAKRVVESFLENYLQFDPLVHVRSAAPTPDAPKILPPSEQAAADAQKEAEEKEPVDGYTLAKFKEARALACVRDDEIGSGALATVFASPVNYNSASAVLNNDSLLDAVVYLAATPSVWEKVKPYLHKDVTKALEIIPPQDTLHRWAYFTEVNYEDLRKATEAIYLDRPCLEWTIGLWDVIEGASNEECEAKFEAYKNRHQDELPMDIKMIQFRGWTPLGDFKENREKIDFYNKNTGVIKKILDRHLEDAKIGKELVKHRVKVRKAANIREQGPDHPDLKSYTETAGPNLKSMGASPAISKEQMKRLEAAKGDLKAAQDLEYIDNIKERLAEFEREMTTRELSVTEKRDYEFYKKQYLEALEMLEVPDEGIRVDVFQNDGSSMSKSTFYTKSEEALDSEAKSDLNSDQAAMLDKVTRYNYAQVRQGLVPQPEVVEKGGSSDLAPFAQQLLDGAKPEDYAATRIMEKIELVDGEYKSSFELVKD